MRIYIAASFPRKDDAIQLAKCLRTAGHRIVSRWHDEDDGYADVSQMPSRALRDLENIEKCHMLIQFTGDNLSHGGRHCELGIAIALRKDIVLLGKREQVLHWLPETDVFETVGDFIYEFAPELMT